MIDFIKWAFIICGSIVAAMALWVSLNQDQFESRYSPIVESRCMDGYRWHKVRGESIYIKSWSKTSQSYIECRKLDGN